MSGDPIRPSYYVRETPCGFPLRPVDVIHAYELGYNLGTALVYICRAGKKPGEPATRDLQKALWHIEDELNVLAAKAAAEVTADRDEAPGRKRKSDSAAVDLADEVAYARFIRNLSRR